MSGHSSVTTCPNCGGDADIYTDWKPFSYTSITCFNCGLTVHPMTSYLTLEELNEYRIDAELEPLESLPQQNKDL